MKVFVYGSLKLGGWNNPILGDSEFVANGVTVEQFILTDCGFPYMINPESVLEQAEMPNPAPVVGEVYNVTDDAVMASLDCLEGVPHHYRRVEIEVKLLDSDEVVKCQAYVTASPEHSLAYKLCEVDHGGRYVWTE